MDKKNGYYQVNLTELVKIIKDKDFTKNLPIQVLYNGEPIFKVVPNTWKDPRYLSLLGSR